MNRPVRLGVLVAPVLFLGPEQFLENYTDCQKDVPIFDNRFEMGAMDDTKDHLERRCPRLGGPVTFQYCKICGDNNRPCFKMIDCWWESFDIQSYLKANLSEDEFNRLLSARPKPKISSIVDLIEQAKKRIE